MTKILNLVKGWKTAFVNIAFTAIPILQLTEFKMVIPMKYLPWYALGIALINLWLRSVTTTPIGQK